ncbi:MAG: sigma-70 family RNA polymerase sigma factor [Eubacteriales bacterium]|nr:sigma-70 family RNA polymerase sigma factor [Clostridiales bacterium]
MNDALLLRAKSGNNAAFSELVEMYSPLINSMVSHFSGDARQYNLEPEDLRQEAIIALYGAVKAFNAEQKDVTFGLFAKICMRNRLISIVRNCRGRAETESSESETDLAASSPEQDLIDRENYERLIQVIDESLTDYEKAVFKLFILDKSYREIAAALGRDVKSVDNAVCRIKRKLKQRI